jgi:hypothetical protein
MDFLAQIAVWLNSVSNALNWLLVPMTWLPDWMKPGWSWGALVSVLSGLLILVTFKYTSNQKAIKRVRDDINANLLALILFKDSARVAVRAQGQLLQGAAQLLVLGLVPTLIMTVPVSLLMVQLALWYQARPLHVGEETLMVMKLNGAEDSPWPDVRLDPNDAVEVTTGPVRVQSQRWICWNIKALKNGPQRLVFQVDGQTVEKELAIGDGYMRVSAMRPGWSWMDVLENPAEAPFRPESPIQSIEIEYPDRSPWKIYGLGPWFGYWFAASMVAGFGFSRVFKVNL